MQVVPSQYDMSFAVNLLLNLTISSVGFLHSGELRLFFALTTHVNQHNIKQSIIQG